MLAKDLGMSLTTLALAFVNQRPFVTSNIIGATNLEQLKENIGQHKHLSFQKKHWTESMQFTPAYP